METSYALIVLFSGWYNNILPSTARSPVNGTGMQTKLLDVNGETWQSTLCTVKWQLKLVRSSSERDCVSTVMAPAIDGDPASSGF